MSSNTSSSSSSSSSSLLASLGAALQALPSARFSSRGGSSGSPTAAKLAQQQRLHPVLSAFESKLALELENLKESCTKLEESDRTSSYLSLPWLTQSMSLLLRIHSNVEAFAPDPQQQHGKDQPGPPKWPMEEYLDESVRLLDVCNVLRESMEDLKGYHRCVEMALHCLSQPSGLDATTTGGSGRDVGQLKRAKAAIAKCSASLQSICKEDSLKNAKLDNCSSTLRRMGERLVATGSNSTSASSSNSSNSGDDASIRTFFNAVYAAQVTTVFFCSVVVAALSFKSSRRYQLSIVGTGGGQYSASWSSNLANLHHKVREQVEKKKTKGSSVFLDEMDKLDVAMRGLQEIVEIELTTVKDQHGLTNSSPSSPKSEGGARNLEGMINAILAVKECGEGLVRGLAHLETQIEELFGALVANRMILLNMYTSH